MSARDAMMSELERDLMSQPTAPPPRKPIPAAVAAAAVREASKSKSAGKRPAIADPPAAAKPAAKKAMFKKEKLLATDGHASTREADDKAMRYVRILQEGANGVPGILSVADTNGDPLIPYMHQRQAVKKAAESNRQFMLLAHDAGTGKTATFFQLLAAMELLVSGGARAIITVPPSTLDQWEETAYNWLNIKHKDLCIVRTNKIKDVDAMMLRRVRVLIISRHLLAALYKQCWEYKQKFEQTERGHWVGKWVRKEGIALHPFWDEKWDLMGVDEAHFMRNPDTEWCVSHNQLAMGVNLGNGKWTGGCRKRIALTATPVFNKPLDMVGLCKAIGTTLEFQDKKYWSLDKQGKTINPHTVKAFQKHTDRVKDDILNLPEIVQETHNFSSGLTEAESVQYNAYQESAKKLKLSIERSHGKPSSQDLQKLMLLLARMQQMLISPTLAKLGAEYFKKNPVEVENAGRRDTGALLALKERILALQSAGHARVIVACNHVELMKIARQFLQNKGALYADQHVGDIFMYDGTLSLQQRQAVRNQFMGADKSVLFLSVGAGGTGLHLVPSSPEQREEAEFCRAMIFWGSRPFSPQQVWQTLKRIHRIGQRFECYVHHLIAYGSVDYAINCVHNDKAGLANAIVDDDWSNCDQQGGNWRRTGRIVDMCCPMLADGNFPPQLPGVVVPPAHHTGASSSGGGRGSGGFGAGDPVQPVAPLQSQFFRQPLQQAAMAAMVPPAPPAMPRPMLPVAPRAPGVPMAGTFRSVPARNIPAPCPSAVNFGRATIQLQPTAAEAYMGMASAQRAQGVLPGM